MTIPAWILDIFAAGASGAGVSAANMAVTAIWSASMPRSHKVAAFSAPAG